MDTALPDAPGMSSPPARALRSAVVDLGSNSVRLVVFEGRGRNPLTIFNEKAVLGLGRGLVATGRLNDDAVEQALTVMVRYHTVARAMGADPVEVLATAAVRDAANGPAFIAALRVRLPDLVIRVLSGDEEGRLSADGVLLGFPDADGVLGDIGGGSLELVELAHGRAGRVASLPLGAIRLAERAGGEVQRARALSDEEFARVPWLPDAAGRDLYLVGGAWRALARMHIAQTAYPLSIVHHYVLMREEARDLAGVVMAATRRTLERMPGAPTKRVADLPWAAVVLRRLLRASGARRVVFSANGLREGWYARALPPDIRQADPLLSAAQELAARFGRDPRLPAALARWTTGLFETESAADAALRIAACWASDIGSHDHPDYRAEHSYFRVLRQPGAGLDHHARAFLALAVALRYEAGPDAAYIQAARVLLDVAAVRRAEILGAALRLAYTLSGGTPELLAGTEIERRGSRLVLRLVEGTGVFAGESVLRRVEALAAVLGLEAAVEVAG
jgi:exopolyphosphatase/guanosine-5'-triphosphate,3'-diphosphate pyrophosphatase